MKIILYIIACFSVGIGYSQLIDRSYFEGALEGKIDKLFEHIKVEDGVIISAYYNQGANQEPVVIRLPPQRMLCSWQVG